MWPNIISPYIRLYKSIRVPFDQFLGVDRPSQNFLATNIGVVEVGLVDKWKTSSS